MSFEKGKEDNSFFLTTEKRGKTRKKGKRQDAKLGRQALFVIFLFLMEVVG